MLQIIALLLTLIVLLLVVIVGQLERIYNLLDSDYPEDEDGGGYIPDSGPDLPPDSDELTEAWYRFIHRIRASNN